MHAMFVRSRAGTTPAVVQLLDQEEPGWEITVVDDAASAYPKLVETRWDAVVCPQAIVGGTGIELLSVARLHQPGAARVLMLDRPLDREQLGSAIEVAHRVIEEPPTLPALRAMLRVLTAPGLRVPDPLRDTIGALDALPAAGGAIRRMQLLLGKDPAPHRFAEVIADDPSLASKVLHVANSGFVSPSTPIRDLTQAAAFLGVELLQEIVMISRALDGVAELGASQDAIEVTRRVGAAAARVGKAMEDDCPHAAVVGLLLDIGLPLMALAWPDDHAVLRTQAMRGPDSLSRLELAAFGVTHADAGAQLLRRWSVPLEIIEAIAGHHFVPLSPEPDSRALGFRLLRGAQLRDGADVDPYHPPVTQPLPPWVDATSTAA